MKEKLFIKITSNDFNAELTLPKLKAERLVKGIVKERRKSYNDNSINGLLTVEFKAI